MVDGAQSEELRDTGNGISGFYLAEPRIRNVELLVAFDIGYLSAVFFDFARRNPEMTTYCFESFSCAHGVIAKFNSSVSYLAEQGRSVVAMELQVSSVSISAG